MALHLLHVRKSGGTAIKFALQQAMKRADGKLVTPHGRVVLHAHSTRLRDVPEGDLAFLAVRDPATRFVSGFYSRLRKGAPRYYREWSDAEQRCFQWFSTPQELADALAGRWGPRKKKAEFAMDSIRHLRRPLIWWTGKAERFRAALPRVLYIARQETLDDDWERLKILLELPSGLHLPRDPIQAHRHTGDDDKTLTPRMLEAVRNWYAEDYRLLEVVDEARKDMIARVEGMAAPSDVRQ